MASELSGAMQELTDGVAFWHRRTPWPRDFHNAVYEELKGENPHGDFTLDWWPPFLKRLQRWVATRPFSGEVLTANFKARIPALKDAWENACKPYVDKDISAVRWEEVSEFPDVVGTIRPTLRPSPVFTSKFCHFLAPGIFPVVDNAAVGNVWSTG